MTQPTVLSDPEFSERLHQFEHTLFRLELQPVYLESSEDDLFAAFLRDEAIPPTTQPQLRNWYTQVSRHIGAGKRIERVRVQEDPPTDYQRFERWLDKWNREAGEVMRYMTRARAHAVGLLPAAGGTDWWLIDSSSLIVMHFDGQGHRIRNELVTDPAVVVQACMWRDLAVHHSVLADSQDSAA